jgi:hypothetical protein
VVATSSGGVAHVGSRCNSPQAVVDHAIDELAVAEALSRARVGKQIRREAHVLHAAREDRVRIAELDGLRGEHHGLEPEPHTLLIVTAPDTRVHAAKDERLARGACPDTGLQHVAQDHFVRPTRGRASCAKWFP